MGAKYQKGLDKTKEFLKSHSAFAEAFFSAEDGVAITEAVEISPYPKQNKKEINKNDD